MPQTAVTYDTGGIAPRDRFAYWSDVICDAYLPIKCATPDRAQFMGKIELDRLSRMTISRVMGSPQEIRRGPSEIGRNTESFFMVSLQLSGTGEVIQDGREAILDPGDFAVYNTADPYHVRCRSDVDQLVLQLPQDAVLRRFPHAEIATARAVTAKGALGALVSEQIRQISDAIVGQPGAVQDQMQEVLIDLVVTGLSSVQPADLELSRPMLMLLSRAKAHVRDNLNDESLDRDTLARAMGMSARNLARIFAREGQSVAGFIRQARLDALARDLANPRMSSQSITELGCKWGLSNAQHLSKLFRETFGQTPSDYRRDKSPRN